MFILPGDVITSKWSTGDRQYSYTVIQRQAWDKPAFEFDLNSWTTSMFKLSDFKEWYLNHQICKYKQIISIMLIFLIHFLTCRLCFKTPVFNCIASLIWIIFLVFCIVHLSKSSKTADSEVNNNNIYSCDILRITVKWWRYVIHSMWAIHLRVVVSIK